MKERKRKANKDRTYDAEGYTRRAGCLCFKTDREEEVRKSWVMSSDVESKGYYGTYKTGHCRSHSIDINAS